MASIPFSLKASGPFPLDEKQIFNSISEFQSLDSTLKYDGMLVVIKGGTERGAYIYNAATNTLETISTANLDPSSIRIRDTNIIYRAPDFDYTIGAGGPTVFRLGVAQNRTVVMTANRPPDEVSIDGATKPVSSGQVTYNHVLPSFGANRTNNGSWNGIEFRRIVPFSARENAKDITNSSGVIVNYTVESTVNKTLTIYGVYPMYSGHIAANLGVNEIFEKIENGRDVDVTFFEIIERRGNRNVTYTLANRKPFFLIPAFYGNLTEIIDNQFNTNALVGSPSQVGFYPELEIPITQLDGLAVQYIPYVYTQGISGSFTFQFRFGPLS